MRCLAFLAAVLLAGTALAQPPKKPVPKTGSDPPPPKAELPKALPPKPVGTGKKIAVLVGVNGYLNKPFENLKFAEADMLALKAKLEEAGFTVTLLLGSGDGDAEASRANIVATLIDRREENKRFAFRDVTGEDDQILVAFSGHGEQIEVTETDDDGKPVKREVPFFCPKRAESGTPSTQVSLNEVLKTFHGGKAKALLLADACRSFAVNKEGTKGAVIDRKRVDSLRPNVGGMFAASDRQAAREHEKAGDAGHGLFFAAVLHAMADEKCRDRDGNVVWSRMTDEIGDAVAKRSKELFPGLKDEEHQIPQPFGGFPRKFVLASAGAAVPPVGERPPMPPPAGGKGRVRVTAAQVAAYTDAAARSRDPILGILTRDDEGTVLDQDDTEKMVKILVNKDGKERQVWVSLSSIEVKK